MATKRKTRLKRKPGKQIKQKKVRKLSYICKTCKFDGENMKGLRAHYKQKFSHHPVHVRKVMSLRKPPRRKVRSKARNKKIISLELIPQATVNCCPRCGLNLTEVAEAMNG